MSRILAMNSAEGRAVVERRQASVLRWARRRIRNDANDWIRVRRRSASLLFFRWFSQASLPGIAVWRTASLRSTYDPAIHAEAKIDQTFRSDIANRKSPWTTGSSPVVTRKGVAVWHRKSERLRAHALRYRDPLSRLVSWSRKVGREWLRRRHFLGAWNASYCARVMSVTTR